MLWNVLKNTLKLKMFLSFSVLYEHFVYRESLKVDPSSYDFVSFLIKSKKKQGLQ